MPKVSIILPTYNGSRFIRDSIEMYNEFRRLALFLNENYNINNIKEYINYSEFIDFIKSKSAFRYQTNKI